MSERVGRRVSKWDVQEVPDKFPSGISHDKAPFEKSGEIINHNGSKQEWNSPKSPASCTNWSDSNPDSAIKSEDKSKWSCVQPPPVNNIAGHKDANIIRDVGMDGTSQNMKTQDGNGIYSRSTSPVRDGRRPRSRSRSPKRGWSTSHRRRPQSRSRTPKRGWSTSHSRSRSSSLGMRNRSRSPSIGMRSRSRSPRHSLMDRSESPTHGFMRNSEGMNARRSRSVSICNDFARGRCRRGSQCRFLHEGTNRHEASRHSGSGSAENRGSRHERNPNTEDRGYTSDRVSHGQNSRIYNRSSECCRDFLNGNCNRGSSCRFIHENTMGDDHGARERTLGNDTQSYPEPGNMRGPCRTNNTPCKYFLTGNCYKGNSCRFSHSGAVHDRDEGSNIGKVDKFLGGPKWSDGGTSLNNKPDRIANSTLDGSAWNQKSSCNENGSWNQKSTWNNNDTWNRKSTWNDNKVVDGWSADNRTSDGSAWNQKSTWNDNKVGDGWSADNKTSDGSAWNQKSTWNDNKVGDGWSADNRTSDGSAWNQKSTWNDTKVVDGWSADNRTSDGSAWNQKSTWNDTNVVDGWSADNRTSDGSGWNQKSTWNDTKVADGWSTDNRTSDGSGWNQKSTWNDNKAVDGWSADNRTSDGSAWNQKSTWKDNKAVDGWSADNRTSDGSSWNQKSTSNDNKAVDGWSADNRTSDGSAWNQKSTWNDNKVVDGWSADNKTSNDSAWNQKSTWNDNKVVDGWSADNRTSNGSAWNQKSTWNDNDKWNQKSTWNNDTWNQKSTWNENKVADARSADNRWGHNLVDERQSVRGSNWGNEAADSVWNQNDKPDHIANSTSNGSAWNQKSSWNDNKVADKRSTDNRWGHNLEDKRQDHNLGNANKSLGDSNWRGKVSEPVNDSEGADSEVKKGPHWGEKGSSGQVGDKVEFKSLTGSSALIDNPSDQDVPRSAPLINGGNTASIGAQKQEGSGELHGFRNTPSARTEGSWHQDVGNSEKAGLSIQDTLPKHTQEQSNQKVYGQWRHPSAAGDPEVMTHPVSTVMTHPEASSMNTQSQQTVLPPTPDLSGSVKGISSPNRPSLLEMVEKIKAGKIDPKISPIIPEASVTGNIVTSEQVAQISHLSASLAQIFGNSVNPMPFGPCSNPIQVGAPVSGNMESSQVSTYPPGFSEDPVKQNNMSDHVSQTPLQSRAPSMVASGLAVNNPVMKNNSVKTLHQESNEAKHLHSVGNERVVDHTVKEHSTAHSGDANTDEDKKCKDEKGMRMFKVALVGFVKEVLKPTWKEGLLTKEAHKTIVKKVVDKVTGTVDPIPHTQSKIDQYLAFSTTKLTKLVEAYLEKFLKS